MTRNQSSEPVQFLVDAQLPPALAAVLVERGHEAEHVRDIGLGNASDRDLWSYTLENDAVIVTKDEDFAAMIVLGTTGPPIVWVRIGNTRRGELIDWFDAQLDEIVALIEAGNRILELR